jgi:hypothetical protein
MPRLRQTTIVSVNCRNPEQSLRAIEASRRQCRFEDALLLSDRVFRHPHIRSEPIEPLSTAEAYSEFILRRLHDFIHTDYCLIVQPDGFVLSGRAWTDDFFAYDYIGAPWDLSFNFPMLTAENRVGNGGFSLRSRKLLFVCKYLYPGPELHPEDVVVCRQHRDFFTGHGVRFAPIELAERFAVENNLYRGQFGFHGELTMRTNHITL